MRRIGLVLGISLVMGLLGVAAFTYGTQASWVATPARATGGPTARLVVNLVTYGALQTAAAPVAPTNLQAKAVNGEIDLSWAKVTGADTYNVYRATSSHTEGTTPYAKGIISLFFYNKKNLDPKVTYYYTVTAVNRTGQESAPATEVSASLTPTVVVGPAHTPAKAGGANFLPLFILLGVLLLAVGGFLLVRSRARPSEAVTGQLAMPTPGVPPLDPATSYGRSSTGSWRGTVPGVDPGTVLGDSPYANETGQFASTVGQPPPPPSLPANATSSAGLLARYGNVTPDEVVADPGPLRELLPDAGDDAWFGDTGEVPTQRGDADARFRPITDNPAWPVQRPRDYTVADEPDSRRTLLLVGAGASFVLGVMALFLFLFFNFFAATNTAPKTSGVVPQQTVVGTANPQVSPTATTMPVPAAAIVSISSGGGGSGAFSADSEVSGGSTDTVNDHIDTSGVQNPAPEAVYQSERWGEFSYHLTGFTANGTYTVRLHFAETYFKNPGQRIFNVLINGQQVLTNFDIIASVGAPDKALVQTFTTTADGSGMITIDYRNGAQNNAKSSGIEVFPAG